LHYTKTPGGGGRWQLRRSVYAARAPCRHRDPLEVGMDCGHTRLPALVCQPSTSVPPASGQTQALQRVLQPRQTLRPSRRFTHRAQHLHAQYACRAFHAAMALYYALDPCRGGRVVPGTGRRDRRAGAGLPRALSVRVRGSPVCRPYGPALGYALVHVAA
jgi:hypothetical protein